MCSKSLLPKQSPEYDTCCTERRLFGSGGGGGGNGGMPPGRSALAGAPGPLSPLGGNAPLQGRGRVTNAPGFTPPTSVRAGLPHINAFLWYSTVKLAHKKEC